MLALTRLQDNLLDAYAGSAPNVICAYAYDLACRANKFYHETKILSEPDETAREGYIALVDLTRAVLEQCINLLGFTAPDKM